MQLCCLGERAEQKVQVMSSGSLALDIALGAGGYLKVVLLKFTDQNHQVKQLLPFMQLLRAQKKVASAAFIDAEHALTCVWQQL